MSISLSTRQINQLAKKIGRDLNPDAIRDDITSEPLEGTFIGSGAGLSGITPDASEIYKKTRGAVVSLQTDAPIIDEETGETVSEFFGGSAFFISADGYMATASHNALTLNDFDDYDAATNLWKRVTNIYASITNVNGVEGQHRIFECEVIGLDGATDVAILKPIGITLTNQAFLEWGSSRDQSNGNGCYVIGNPEAIDIASISAGIIRDNRHFNDALGSVESVLVDTPGTAGNSGGPIIDKDCKVIGVFTFGEGATGSLGGGPAQFLVEDIADVIMAYDRDGRPQRIGYDKTDSPPFPDADHPKVYNNGEFIKGYLGAFVVAVTPIDMFTFLNGAYLDLRGVYVFLIDETLTAEEALLKEDSILISVDGVILGTQDDQYSPSAITWAKRPGDTVELVVREKEDNFLVEKTVTVELLQWKIFDIALTPFARGPSRRFFPSKRRSRKSSRRARRLRNSIGSSKRRRRRRRSRGLKRLITKFR
jgi:S1-C subfamily serine protease